jgi:hypothetical protein
MDMECKVSSQPVYCQAVPAYIDYLWLDGHYDCVRQNILCSEYLYLHKYCNVLGGSTYTYSTLQLSSVGGSPNTLKQYLSEQTFYQRLHYSTLSQETPPTGLSQ